MAKYKMIFDLLICDKKINRMMREADLLGGGNVGTQTTLSLETSTEPTKEYIEKMEQYLESYEDDARLFSGVKCASIETIL